MSPTEEGGMAAILVHSEALSLSSHLIEGVVGILQGYEKSIIDVYLGESLFVFNNF